MIDIEKVVKEVANNLNLDKEIVDQICKHAFKTTVDIMKSEEDCRDILFNKLFKFKLKRRFNYNKTRKYSKA